jgi:hypothetical protein
MDRTREEIFTALVIFVITVPEPTTEPSAHCCLDSFNADGF